MFCRLEFKDLIDKLMFFDVKAYLGRKLGNCGLFNMKNIVWGWGGYAGTVTEFLMNLHRQIPPKSHRAFGLIFVILC